MSDYDYDLFVIGAGSGGVRAARIASGHGARVAVAEEYRVGGTCVIRGCVPKKLFVYASHFAEDFRAAGGYGWTVPEARFDWPTLLANKDREIDRLNGIYIRNLKSAGVEILQTRATLAGPHRVRLEAENREVTARVVLVATGATPFVPDIPGAEHAVTSNEAFHLERLPEHVTIVGGGYIAVEFAGIFNGLGVNVSLLYRGEEIMRGFDDDIRACLREEMTARGVDVRVLADPASIEADAEGGYAVRLKSGDKLETGLVMYATGRKPNAEGLGLQAAGVELGWNGQVVVDEYSKSSVDWIYAVGDVTDRNQLTPVAIREGHAFADTVFGDRPTLVDHAGIATAVFSQPEIGTVGLTEAEARERCRVQVYKSRFKPMKNTLSGSAEQMLMKLVVDAESDTVLGCHILGEGAGEMAQLLGIAVKMGATKADFDATMAVHPTASEELVTMRDPVRPKDLAPSQ